MEVRSRQAGYNFGSEPGSEQVGRNEAGCAPRARQRLPPRPGQPRARPARPAAGPPPASRSPPSSGLPCPLAGRRVRRLRREKAPGRCRGEASVARARPARGRALPWIASCGRRGRRAPAPRPRAEVADTGPSPAPSLARRPAVGFDTAALAARGGSIVPPDAPELRFRSTSRRRQPSTGWRIARTRGIRLFN